MGATSGAFRFVPREHGNWSWSGRITGGAKPVEAAGSFKCQGTQGHGFLRISKQNPFRYEYEDGTPFYPIGIQTCNFLQPDFDGPEAGTAENRWVSNTLPAVPSIRPGVATNLVMDGRLDADAYLAI